MLCRRTVTTKKLGGILLGALIASFGALGCGDDHSGGPGGGGPKSPFGPDQLWGPPGTPLPPGAEVVSVGELIELSRGDGFELITHAEIEAAIETNRQEVADARAYVDGLAEDPALAYLK